MKYTSEELNKKISELDTANSTNKLSVKGGKLIPYIGWYWRDVNFDNVAYSFGIIAPNEYNTSIPEENRFTGFMENNKWGYGYTRNTTLEEWETIKNMLCDVVDGPTEQNVSGLWNYIQNIK